MSVSSTSSRTQLKNNRVNFLFAVLCIVAWLRPAGAEGFRSKMLEEANRNKILLLTVGSEPRTLDPQQAQGVTEQHIIMAMIEGLVADEPNDQAKQVPGMAESWEHNQDYSVWTFHIGADRKWSNADPVTAQDFVFSYRRMLTPSFASPYVDSLFIIKGGEDYYKEKLTDFNQVGVKALDERTLRIELIGPTPYFLSALRHTSWFPINPKTILKFGRFDERDTKWTRPENFVGNGAFKMKTWRENDVIQMVRNPLYWDAASVKLNGINFYAIENLDTSDRAFEAGQLHRTDTVPLDKIPYYRRLHPDLLRIDPYLGTYFYRLNVNQPALKDSRVRLALNLAVDREAIVKDITRGNQLAATGFTPAMPGYSAFDKIRFDPERARQLLAEAGYPNGRGFPKFNILINTQEAHRTIAEAIQQMWSEELNIQVGIENEEWKVYLDTLNKINYSVARSAWIGDYVDPSTFLNMWTTGNGNNNTNWGNPKYDQLIALAEKTADPAARLKTLREAEEILLTDLPIVLVYWYTHVYQLEPSVLNWNSLILDNHNYKFIDLKSDEISLKK
ncbi:MAG: peptide ABC transporter substrate-binding protein [Verrucomicrobia bacterium]|nr:peptide ABC transporter substrate-binding protein [Verrucomicrobiota bacterium]